MIEPMDAYRIMLERRSIAADTADRSLWTAAVALHGAIVDLSWWCHGEDCARRASEDECHEDCPSLRDDGPDCDGQACWRDVACDCGLDDLRAKLDRTAAGLCDLAAAGTLAKR